MSELKARSGKMIFKSMISVDPVMSEGTKKKQWWKHWSITRDRRVTATWIVFLFRLGKKGCHRTGAHN